MKINIKFSAYACFFTTLTIFMLSLALFSCAASLPTAKPITIAADPERFNPSNLQHLFVSIVNTQDPLKVAVSEQSATADNGNPTIVIEGLTNSGASATEPAIPAYWTVTVHSKADPAVFTTASGNDVVLLIDNPAGNQATNTNMSNAFTVTNYYNEGPADDEVVTYNVVFMTTDDDVVKFTPSLPAHLRVSLAGETEPLTTIAATVTPATSPNANPTIVITGLTNSGETATAAALPAKWALTVPANAAPKLFSTGGEDIVINIADPVGNADTTVKIAQTITVTNLYEAGEEDDNVVTYNVEVSFTQLPSAFAPTNPAHLRVSQTGTTYPLPLSVSVEPPVDDNSHSTIILAGLTNSGLSRAAVRVVDKWELTVPANAAPALFSTGSDDDIVISITDPVGNADTNVNIDETITITNLYETGEEDDKVITYRVRFSFGAGGVLALRVKSPDVVGGLATVHSRGTLAVSSRCTMVPLSAFVVTIDDIPNLDYAPAKIHTYYNRNHPVSGMTVDHANNLITVRQSGKIRKTNADFANFDFVMTFPPCMPTDLGEYKTGTSDYNAYEISRAEHLEAFAYFVNESNAEYADKHYKVTAPIDLGKAGAPWGETYTKAYNYLVSPGFIPIGRDETKSFKGILDCNSHVMSNLYMDLRYAREHKGFLGHVEGGKINSCALENVQIIGGDYVGGLVAISSAGTTIANSYVEGNVLGYDYVGGLVGAAETGSVIDNSYVIGDVTGDDYVGGLAGVIRNSSASHTYATATVQGDEAIGGLAGGVTHGSIVRDSHALGAVVGDEGVGGLAGEVVVGSVINSYAAGNVQGTNTKFLIGGLVGGVHTGNVTNSYALGTVSGHRLVGGLTGALTSANVKSSYAMGAVSGSEDVGGLSGVVSGHANVPSIIDSSYAMGDVSGALRIGGLAGTVSDKSMISNSDAGGSVSGFVSIGGLVGRVDFDASVQNSYATGSVEGSNHIGGLTGLVSSRGSIANSYATGTVLGGISAGGLVGTAQIDSTVSNSYATGSVVGIANLGGLAGYIKFNTEVSTSYAIGSVSGLINIGGIAGQVSSDTNTDAYWVNSKVVNSYWNISAIQSSREDRTAESKRGVGNYNLPLHLTNQSYGYSAVELQASRTGRDNTPYNGWDTSVWSFASGRYPILRTVPCMERQFASTIPATCRRSLPSQ